MQDEADLDFMADPLPAPTTVNERSLRPRRATSSTGSRAPSASTSRSNSVQRTHATLHESSTFDLPAISIDIPMIELESSIPGNVPELFEDDGIPQGEDQDGHERKRRRADEDENGTADISHTIPGPSFSMAVRPNDIDRVGTAQKRVRIEPAPHGIPDSPSSIDTAVENFRGNDDDGARASFPPPHRFSSWNMPASNPVTSESLDVPVSLMSAPRAGPSRWLEAGHSSTAGGEYNNFDTASRNTEPLTTTPAGPMEGPIETPFLASQSSKISQPAIADPAKAEGVVRSPEPLSAFICPICFCPPSYATLTPCGHVCCGECLFTAVRASLSRATYALPLRERMIARCPVCRAPIPGWDGKGGGIIGLKPRALFSL